MCRYMLGLFWGVNCLVGGRCIASLGDIERCQVAYLADGSIRFDSVGVETARGYSLGSLEHSWQALARDSS